MVLVLFESSLGYTLFKLQDGAALDKPEAYKQDSSNLAKLLSLSAIQRFSSTAEGVEEISSIQEGKLSKSLKKFLVDEVQGKSSSKKGKKGEVNEQLVVSDPKLGQFPQLARLSHLISDFFSLCWSCRWCNRKEARSQCSVRLDDAGPVQRY
jgi:nucleolar protein 58